MPMIHCGNVARVGTCLGNQGFQGGVLGVLTKPLALPYCSTIVVRLQDIAGQSANGFTSFEVDVDDD
ncbi:MAG: hypothetical protein ACREOM_11285 [Candidatus Dormibacteraceae bacterium]